MPNFTLTDSRRSMGLMSSSRSSNRVSKRSGLLSLEEYQAVIKESTAGSESCFLSEEMELETLNEARALANSQSLNES